MALLTTLGVGGPARYLVEARTADDVRQAVYEAQSKGWPLFVLGGGSNLVVSDAGWPGMVLKIAITGIDQRREDDKEIFEVGAGEEWDSFVGVAVRQNCAGVECLSGIPGTVGGTPVQNVGAYGQEVSETIQSVQTLDLTTGHTYEFCKEACEFAYRESLFNTRAKGRYIILRVTFGLQHGGEPKLDYADLRRYFADRTDRPTLQDTRQAVRNIRQQKAMLIVQGDEDCRSAGSFFKNPIVTPHEYERLADQAAYHGLQMPHFGTPQGVKVPAAWLVEHSGFQKGYQRGPVAISRRHALAIVNRGGATAADVIALKNEIQQRVRDHWDIQLHPEPVFVGFESAGLIAAE